MKNTKKNIVMSTLALSLFVTNTFAQDIPQSKVPSLVVNNFQQLFPKAFDVEWKLDGEMYKVEFETGLLNSDHDAWYNNVGKLVKHKEEISKNDLPQKVLIKINLDYSGYTIDDVEKITEGENTIYTLELKKNKEEWKLAFAPDGTVLSKIAD